MTSPVLNVQEVRITDDGDLQKGIYFYVLVEVDDDGTEYFVNTMQVYAGYKGNSIHVFWNPVKGKAYYRLYRGTSFESFDGYFSVYGDDGYFCDNGMGVLNLKKLTPYATN
jgi:hypothetical protein